jgi:hypothetical protein
MSMTRCHPTASHAKEDAMKSLTASIVVGSLLLLPGVASAAIAQLPAPNPHVQLVADDDRASFTQQAEGDMRDWGRKIHNFGRQVKTSGQEGAHSAKHDLDVAYSKARVAADNLKTVGADGWEGAKSTYQQAQHDLAETWDRIKP